MISKVKSVLANPSKLRRVPSYLLESIARFYYSRKNHHIFLRSGKRAVGGVPYDLDIVQRQFAEAGHRPVDYFADGAAFHAFCKRHEEAYREYKTGYGELFIEKALEHFVSLSFMQLSATSSVIDIANAGSPFPEVVHSEFGCNVWSNDLTLPKGRRHVAWHTQIEGNACSMPIEDRSMDLAVLHCALEMFEGAADTGVVREAGRILKPGGKLVILPLYMHERYHVLRHIRTHRHPLPEIDEGAELIYCEGFEGFAFIRFYSVDAFMKRLVEESADLEVTIYRVRNPKEIHPTCYLDWIAVFTKTATL